MFNHKSSSLALASPHKPLYGKPAVIVNSPKPVNIFYIWYTELCRRLNQTPLNVVKPAKPKNETVLDFITDRIKPEEWTPIINALKLDTSLHVLCLHAKVQCKFMDDINTEEKVRSMKRRAGSIWTPYILKNLVNSISYSICRTPVLTYLEFDGLPIMTEYLETLLDCIKKNSTIKVLSLKHCSITDLGCEKVCQTLRFVPNIEIINLSSCLLGSSSAQNIAKLIRYQQINRYCESWHSSLRYEDPEVGIMAGLKRVTLNNNPNIGDEGLMFILNELDDDLWIKAIDMQKCSITNSVANRLIDIVDYNKSLEIADFRNNEELSAVTVARILDILKNKPRLGEFQWCGTASSLQYQSSVMDTACSSVNVQRYIQIQKSKSTPLKTCDSKRSTHSLGLRRMKTSITIPLKSDKEDKASSTRVTSLADAKKEVLQLNAQLQKEILKRVQTEEENLKLKNEINAIKSSGIPLQNKKFNLPRSNSLRSNNRTTLQKTKPQEESNMSTSTKDYKNGLNSINRGNHSKKSVEFVFNRDDKSKSSAQNLFQNILNQNTNAPTDESDKAGGFTSDNEFDEYFQDKSSSPSPKDSSESDCLQSESNSSLVQFMEEIEMMDDTKMEKSKSNNSWNGKKKRNLLNSLGLVT